MPLLSFEQLQDVSHPVGWLAWLLKYTTALPPPILVPCRAFLTASRPPCDMAAQSSLAPLEPTLDLSSAFSQEGEGIKAEPAPEGRASEPAGSGHSGAARTAVVPASPTGTVAAAAGLQPPSPLASQVQAAMPAAAPALPAGSASALLPPGALAAALVQGQLGGLPGLSMYNAAAAAAAAAVAASAAPLCVPSSPIPCLGWVPA